MLLSCCQPSCASPEEKVRCPDADSEEATAKEFFVKLHGGKEEPACLPSHHQGKGGGGDGEHAR